MIMAATKSLLLISLLLVLYCSSGTSLQSNINIVCGSVWDVRNSSFTISVNWTIGSGVPVNTINVFQINFDQLKGGEESVATRLFDIPPKMDTYSYSIIESDVVPYTYIDPMIDDGSTSLLTGYYYIASVFNDVDGTAPTDVQGSCEVPLSPTRPSQASSVGILQSDIQLHDISGLTVARINSVSLQWSLPSNPVVTDLSNLGYQIWVGFTDPGFTRDLDDIIVVNETMRIGFITSINSVLSVPSTSKHIFVKMRCYYEIITGGNGTHRIYSDWSTPNPISIISNNTPTISTSTPTILSTSIENILITGSTQQLPLLISSSAPSTSNRISPSMQSTSLPTNDTSHSMSKGLVSAGGNGLVVIVAVSISIALLLAVIVIIIGFLVVCISRRRKLQTLCHDLDSKVPTGLENECSFFKGGKVHCSMTTLPQQQSVLVLEGATADEWELPTNAVIILKRLGGGCFGEVFKGEVKGFKNPHLVSYETRNNNGRFVAIKILKNNSSNQEKNEFLEEIELMKVIAKGHNPHVVNMLGAVTRQEPMCLVTEYLEHGDLLGYLRNAQCHYDDNIPENGQHGLPQSVDFTSFAYQIASGMDYLSSLKVIHRDLACRNILVGEGRVLKVSDFGLSRNTTYDSVYVKTSNGPLPIRWMAIESIMYHEFTTASDVWSFGITLWEIGTLGAVPYPNIDNSDILRTLQNGNRVDKPSTITDEVYKIMSTCFAEDPKQRPTFCELRKTFDLIFSKDKNIKDMYLDLCLTSEPKLAARLTSPITNTPTSNVYVDN